MTVVSPPRYPLRQMATSFVDQIPSVVFLIQQLKPKTLLDIGKGLGKYGFLAHEYSGLSYAHAPDPTRTVAEQSALAIDAVEVEETFLWPHLYQFYRKVYVGKAEEIYPTLPMYDVVLMADVIEHIEKECANALVQHFIERGSSVIVSTPKKFFAQHLFESKYEEHVSHWEPRDFSFAPFMDYQNVGPGRVYLLAQAPRWIRGFGNRPTARVRRLARFFRDEFV